MKCPYCNEEGDRVVDSRSSREGRAIRRRRECVSCSKRYTSYEYIEIIDISIIKNDGTRQEYDRKKLQIGITAACKKRPVSNKKIETLLDSIETKIQEKGQNEVSSGDLGTWVMEALQDLDDVAYVRFASVYRQFKSREEFIKELQDINHIVMYVTKKNGMQEEYDRQKLRRSIEAACKKRPISARNIDIIIKEVEKSMKKKKEISAEAIGTVVLESLSKTDFIAYMRYSSIFKDFRSKEDMINELQKL